MNLILMNDSCFLTSTFNIFESIYIHLYTLREPFNIFLVYLHSFVPSVSDHLTNAASDHLFQANLQPHMTTFLTNLR